MATEPQKEAVSLRGTRRSGRRPRRRAILRPTFASTLRALEGLVAADGRVAVHVADLDRGTVLLGGDDHVTMPVGGVGTVPLLVEAAAQFEEGTLDPYEVVARDPLDPLRVSGVWRHLQARELPLIDVAVLTATSDDALAANALLERVGHERVSRRYVSLGMPRSALLDHFRDRRGPDDAPHVALGTAREFAVLFADIVSGKAAGATVSAQVAEWLTLNHDLSLVGSATGLAPFAHDDDGHGLLFLNKTGRDRDVRAEAGVLAGARGGVAYALFVEFDDASILHRDRAHEAFRVLGRELMEYAA
ncbi:class A beta-lactamase-related serine hydrolase [Microbacterium betulae]|uniref:Class A beta-lactamase-related serine hydrolase n=1 Tax=Microbacterium betulae TaxID=2981139 RepID=A0AA97FHX9_9MICO|nr:serine hydrolase [Microbacterium sp. AB]WOF22998.1 class A beta-lactamase-related serine hydrolase [Microbacterium sp. AB]